MTTYSITLKKKDEPKPRTVVVEAETAILAMKQARLDYGSPDILSCEIVRVDG